MINISNLNITKINGTKLIEDLTFHINDGDRCAVIGEEGNGKSTLIKAIYNKSLIDDYAKCEGTLEVKDEIIGYLPQHMPDEWNELLPYEFLLKDKASDVLTSDDYNRLEIFASLFDEMHLDKNILDSDTPIKNLSGGEKVRLQLIKILGKPLTLLLLDEPTNDLDIETLEFLEDLILESKIPVLYISHDETLLSKTANRILHLEQPNMKTKQKYTYFNGSYDSYKESRQRKYENEIQIANKEKAEYLEKKRKLNDIMNAVHAAQNNISRADPSTGRLLKKKMHAVKSMERRFEKESYSKYDYNEEAIKVFFDKVSINGDKVLINYENENLRILGRDLINNFKLFIKGSDRIVITGKNGSGKSLLLEKIYHNLKNRKDIKLGYMPQNYMKYLEGFKNPVDFLLEIADKDDISYSRQLLGAMKFTREEMLSEISNLSDGQKAKLYILRLIKRKCDVLLLDEPTRNFSPLSAPVIRSILTNFTGCIISVSHDRLFINEVPDTVYSIEENKLLKKTQ